MVRTSLRPPAGAGELQDEQIGFVRRVNTVAMRPNLDPVATHFDQPPRFSRHRYRVPRGTENEFVGEEGKHAKDEG